MTASLLEQLADLPKAEADALIRATSVAPLASSGAKARASVIGATGFWVRGLVIVLQIRSSGIPRAFMSFT